MANLAVTLKDHFLWGGGSRKAVQATQPPALRIRPRECQQAPARVPLAA